MKFAKTSIAHKEENYHSLMEELLENFSKRCGEAGVRCSEFNMQGTPAGAILQESNYFDCVVVGLRTFFTYGSGAGADGEYGTDDDEPGDSLERIMDQSLAPVFAVPLDWKPDDEFSALIAVNGSPHSMRALRQFARLYGGSKARVTLMHCSDDGNGSTEMLTKSAAFLRAHQAGLADHPPDPPSGGCGGLALCLRLVGRRAVLRHLGDGKAARPPQRDQTGRRPALGRFAAKS